MTDFLISCYLTSDLIIEYTLKYRIKYLCLHFKFPDFISISKFIEQFFYILIIFINFTIGQRLTGLCNLIQIPYYK